MRKAVATAAVSALLSGCASPDSVSTAESPSVREYPTGSNIPRKNRDPKSEGISVHSREDLERLQGSGYNAPSAGAGQSR